MVDALEQYGIPVHPHLMPAEQLCTLLLYYAPLRPLEVYITAARYDVYTLASGRARGSVFSCDWGHYFCNINLVVV